MLELNLHILKTDAADHLHLEKVQSFLNQHPSIVRWHVDLEDVDKVLKAETQACLSELELIQELEQQGVCCELLPD